MVHWCDKRASVALVGRELERRGWMLYGWKEDRSDSMTDYYDPESWDGVATHPQRPGVVACVDVSSYTVKSSSGGVRRVDQVKGEICSRCKGAQADPDGWTLETARKDPHGWHASVNAGTGAVSLMPGVVSPIPFLGHGWGAGCPESYDYPRELHGHERCRQCSGRGHTLKPVERIEPWPTFQANPKGASWHVERAGRIVAQGSGVYTIREANAHLEPWASKQAEKLKALCDRIEQAAGGAPQPPLPDAEHVAGSGLEPQPQGSGPTVRPGKRPGFVEVVFPAKPDEETRAALKAAGFRWAPSGGCWYGQSAAVPARFA